LEEGALICKSRDNLVRYQTQIANGSSATTPGQAATVRSPLIAATATFALNAALCFFRVRFMFCSRAIRAF
jgi:hypothetical protein